MLSLRPWLFGGTFQLEVGFAMGFANLAGGVPGTIRNGFREATVISATARVG